MFPKWLAFETKNLVGLLF